MSRFNSLAIVVSLTGALAGSAYAESQAEIAARLNEEGKELMYADRYAEAAKKFQEAVARVPEAKYFVNLCAARLQEGKLDEALTACNAVDLNNPTPGQKAAATKLIGRIHEEAKEQNLELHPGGGGGGDPGVDPIDPPDPSVTDPSRPPPPAHTPTVGRPLDTNLVVAASPANRYTWTLGVDLFGGGGRVGQTDFYGTAVGGLRVKGDFLLDPIRRIGGQGYLQASHFGSGARDLPDVETLDIFDVGVAAYKHACLGRTPRLCITPLAGVHLSLMSPAGEMDVTGSQVFNYAGVGGRLELALAYAFGQRFEHVVSAMVGANLYSPVLAGPSAGNPAGSPSAAEAGLDRGGATGYFGLGYTYRFDTPIGSTPFIILE